MALGIANKTVPSCSRIVKTPTLIRLKVPLFPSCINYGVRMFGLGTFRLIAFIIICSGKEAYFGKTESEGGNNVTSFGSRVQYKSGYVNESADEASKNNYSTNKQYLVEYNDYMDVPNFKKHESEHMENYNFVPGNSFDGRTAANDNIIINKCCPWKFYFDTDDLSCVQPDKEVENLTRFDIFNNKIKNYENESNYLFIEKIPDCGSRSVLSVQLMPKVEISSSGVVIESGDVASSEYCIDEDPKQPNRTVVLTCDDPEVFCQKFTCFRKCCPVRESYSMSGRKCQKTDSPFKPEFYNLTTLARNDSVSLSQFGIYLGDACETVGKYLLEKDQGEISFLGIDGTLFVPMYEKRYAEKEFCVEHVNIENQSGIGSFLCFSKNPTSFENSQLQFILLSVGMIISCMFLMITFLVYLFSPKSQNLNGKTLMCYIASLFTAYLCLAMVELKSRELDKSDCVNMGYAILFSFLAAFFWLNVMSFDIWKTFRLDRCVEKSKTAKGRLRFLYYSLYAWSCPCVITGICVFINQTPNFPYESIKGDIGEENCWFSKKKKGIYVFFIAPISLVITCNIIFYVQTAWKIWKVKSDINKMERHKTKKFSANKNQFMINGKLFIIMGITWSLEIISFFLPHPIWYITDTANALHGVFIFAIFVLKKKVLQQVSQRLRLPLKKKQLKNAESTDVSTRKNIKDLDAALDGKTCATGTGPTLSGESKN